MTGAGDSRGPGAGAPTPGTAPGDVLRATVSSPRPGPEPSLAPTATASSIPHPFNLQGKVALVTGATGLLGREHCRALAAHGAQLVITDLASDAIDRVRDDLAHGGLGSHLGLVLDVADPASVETVRKEVLGAFGRLDILVNNAAIDDKAESREGAPPGRFEDYPLSHWQRALDVNVTGVFLCAQILGAEMARAGSGSIINIASIYGVVAPDPSLYLRPDGSRLMYKNAAYPVTKAAVLSLTRYLAAYWGERGVRVNALSPGGVENGQEESFVANYARRTPLGRMARASEYQGALVFLASDASSYVTGANLVADGGWTTW